MGGGRLASGDRSCAREERGSGWGAKRHKEAETERNARACLPLQRSSQKERGNRKSLSLKGGLLCVNTEPYAVMQCMYLDYVGTSGHRILG